MFFLKGVNPDNIKITQLEKTPDDFNIHGDKGDRSSK